MSPLTKTTGQASKNRKITPPALTIRKYNKKKRLKIDCHRPMINDELIEVVCMIKTYILEYQASLIAVALSLLLRHSDY
jgi:hypothetical protein